MHYEGTIIRPPSEAGSIILQVTVGCSHNRCTFCGAYRDRSFRLKDRETIDRDLAFAARYCRRQKTVFLADGDVLVLPHGQLVELLGRIRTSLPWVRRVSLYANCRDILRRSVAQLRELRTLGLGRIYMGLESGDDTVLRAVNKGADGEAMICAGQRVREAGLFLSVTCLLGLGGIDRSTEHALATARVLSRMGPSQIAVLTLMLLDNTELGQAAVEGRFVLPPPDQLFAELRTLVAAIEVKRAQFQANHASNYFTLEGRLPRDREKFLAIIDRALEGRLALKPETLRAL
ncbi:radical SAM protein [Desulfolithobacter sp.]